jgi:hypothetical protein
VRTCRILVVVMAVVTACCGMWLASRQSTEREAKPALA